MPVAWVYLTGWVTHDGTVNFREDVYKHDNSLTERTRRRRGRRFRAPVRQVSNLDSR